MKFFLKGFHLFPILSAPLQVKGEDFYNWHDTLSSHHGLRGANETGKGLSETYLLDKEQLLEDKEITRRTQSCSEDKKVKIYKFCINGDFDGGAHGEHKLRLDGYPYWPTSGYLKLREGQCHNLDNTPWYKVNAWKSLDVGTEEVDDSWMGSSSESTVAYLSSNEWYNPTCNTYGVGIYKKLKSNIQHSTCVEFGAQVGNKVGSINAGVERCQSWQAPYESYSWHMQVEPATKGHETYNPGYYRFINTFGDQYCLHLSHSRTANGNPIQLYSCNQSKAQLWWYDSLGRIRSKLNDKYCVEAGSTGTLYAKLYVWGCHYGMHQRWTLQSDGRIRNKAYSKYIGVAGGCNGVSTGKRLELHNMHRNGWCANQQIWNF